MLLLSDSEHDELFIYQTAITIRNRTKIDERADLLPEQQIDWYTLSRSAVFRTLLKEAIKTEGRNVSVSVHQTC